MCNHHKYTIKLTLQIWMYMKLLAFTFSAIICDVTSYTFAYCLSLWPILKSPCCLHFSLQMKYKNLSFFAWILFSNFDGICEETVKRGFKIRNRLKNLQSRYSTEQNWVKNTISPPTGWKHSSQNKVQERLRYATK